MTAVLAALCAALAVGTLSWRAAHVRRSPARRIAPYTEVARARLGAPVHSVGEPAFLGEAARRLLGPLATAVVGWVVKTLRVSDRDGLELRLRQAGSPLTVEAYRRRHLRWSLAAPLASALVGVATGSPVLTVLLLALGVVGGTRRMSDQLRADTRRRSARLRSDLPTIAGILSPRIENNKSLAVALETLVNEGSGPVIDDLARALHLSAIGYGLAGGLDTVAQESVEPAATRFYQFLKTATTGGIDLPSALLDQADELRAMRREEVERSAARRQMSMVIPNVALMAPVMVVFLLAPIPWLIFGT